jgi:hypothetical protein
LPEANRPWSDEERHAVLERLPAHMKLPVGLMMFAGLGPKDALKLPRSFFKEGEIATRRSEDGRAGLLAMSRSIDRSRGIGADP